MSDKPEGAGKQTNSPAERRATMSVPMSTDTKHPDQKSVGDGASSTSSYKSFES